MISYDPLYEYMEKNHITTYALFKAGFNSATYYNMKKGKSVSVNTINQLNIWNGSKEKYELKNYRNNKEIFTMLS